MEKRIQLLNAEKQLKLHESKYNYFFRKNQHLTTRFKQLESFKQKFKDYKEAQKSRQLPLSPRKNIHLEDQKLKTKNPKLFYYIKGRENRNKSLENKQNLNKWERGVFKHRDPDLYYEIENFHPNMTRNERN